MNLTPKNPTQTSYFILKYDMTNPFDDVLDEPTFCSYKNRLKKVTTKKKLRAPLFPLFVILVSNQSKKVDGVIKN